MASKLAKHLEEMSGLAQQASEMNKVISQITKDHIENVRQIGQEMQGMTQLSHDVATSLTGGRGLAEKLQTRVDQLGLDLSRFRL
jgi:methyl-accepting chemotaxis protein